MTVLAKRLQKQASEVVTGKPELTPESSDEVVYIDPDLIPDIVKNPLKIYEDPRPDLEEDSNLWLQMFIEADKINSKLAKNLYDMRVWGSRIVRGKTQFIIRPDIDPEGIRAWPDQAIYEKWRDRLLKPYTKQIKEILKNLFVWEDNK